MGQTNRVGRPIIPAVVRIVNLQFGNLRICINLQHLRLLKFVKIGNMFRITIVDMLVDHLGNGAS